MKKTSSLRQKMIIPSESWILLDPATKSTDASTGSIPGKDLDTCTLSLPSSGTTELWVFLCSEVNDERSILEDGRLRSISSVALERTFRISSWIVQEPAEKVPLFCQI